MAKDQAHYSSTGLCNKYAIMYQYGFSIRIGIVLASSIEMAKFRLGLVLRANEPYLKYGTARIWDVFYMN
ncbi:hypothetical protein [uncultured Sunxiuqinia sp.]|uniref:hypothetical protein n=1 Tax=uncultured Sunxiuqinia sp. TaxID=1573825 RepID=UPI002AA68F8A|nr:hypothetical protein [uncultured Sunxiuqinia sp.]